ncbi:hypothetical protein QZJ86_18575 [Methylomonas montana]|uniref:hypothetical protein n=1 Tax=Methylomonas montana TaxID=3058963 RepID=UPI00265AF551|nr:hypothetical protein [Methylomonas montana]WKJ89988.1 hypothetical protein QZJ86_18575 [Methylomonas montana]
MSEILFQPLGNPIAAGLGLDTLADIDPRLTRSHYFDGRLLTAEDLTRDQIYLDQRLRELGRVLGSGVIGGLQLSFDRFTGLLTLEPGLAMTPAGRVLELGSRLIVNLRDRALISGLNDGNFSTLNRGLYAVVLRYVDVGTDIAEVFPKDLSAKRGFQYAMITESVQMGLVPLPIPLPQQSPLQIRARLMRELLGDDQLHGLLPEDAVALGLVAIQEGAPQWLDAELLRHPLRAEPGIDSLQSDMSRQYEALLTDILVNRRSGGLTGDFHASDYFSLLPPVGNLPKEAVDPVNGRQGYFPENYQVAIAPLRQSDVELIRSESLALPPIDLSNGEPVDIVVLVPLSNLDYGHYAAQLERNFDPNKRLLPQLDLLRLKLYPVRPVHALDTDQAAWQAIWDRFGSNSPLYVRRPSRAAETSVSGIVLALGTALPLPPEAGGGPADTGGLIEDEDSVFLRRVNYPMLAEVRAPSDDAGRTALAALVESFNESALVAASQRILLLVERHYDPVVWQTLQQLAAANNLDAFSGALRAKPTEQSTGELVVAGGAALGLSNELIGQWTALLP